MSATHSPGPLKIAHGAFVTSDSVEIGPHPLCSPHEKANATRVLACWDACQNIPTAALEDGVLTELIQVGINTDKARRLDCFCDLMQTVCGPRAKCDGCRLRAALAKINGEPTP